MKYKDYIKESRELSKVTKDVIKGSTPQKVESELRGVLTLKGGPSDTVLWSLKAKWGSDTTSDPIDDHVIFLGYIDKHSCVVRTKSFGPVLVIMNNADFTKYAAGEELKFKMKFTAKVNVESGAYHSSESAKIKDAYYVTYKATLGRETVSNTESGSLNISKMSKDEYHSIFKKEKTRIEDLGIKHNLAKPPFQVYDITEETAEILKNTALKNSDPQRGILSRIFGEEVESEKLVSESKGGPGSITGKPGRGYNIKAVLDKVVGYGFSQFWLDDEITVKKIAPNHVKLLDKKIIEEKWFKNNKLHRLDGPAIVGYGPISGNVTLEMFFEDGTHHRSDGPAKIVYNSNGVEIKSEHWIKNGNSYRADGPYYIEYDSRGNITSENWSFEPSGHERLSWEAKITKGKIGYTSDRW